MSLDFETLHRGSDNKFHVTEIETDSDVVLDEMFPIEYWDSPEAFKMSSIRGYEPMTAKELETDEQQEEALSDTSNILEEKFDGTRALVYFLSQKCIESGEYVSEVGWCRTFSRRISKKTGFYVENSDSVPHIREINAPSMSGTILDGEMFIDGQPFKEVASTLNCLWDKAIDRQIEKGFITFHAFDILFYKGIDLRKLPLERRKVYLKLAVEEIDNPYIVDTPYYTCGDTIPADLHAEILDRVGSYEDPYYDSLEEDKDTYPNLYKCWKEETPLTPRAFYELIVSTGGEGLIVKPKKGKYLHKRGWEYSKIKKFLTRELILLGFSEPTKEYTGKDKKNWGFWVEVDTDKRMQGNFYGDKRYVPVTRHYYYSQVGNLRLGVIVSKEDLDKIPKNKQGDLFFMGLKDSVMQVCECAGFDDETREYFTRNRKSLVGSVIEVKANELFRDSGKMRHPRYMRQRFDKSAEQCTWIDHVGTSEVTK